MADVMAPTDVEHGLPAPSARVDVLGCPIDQLDMAGTVARCDALIRSGGFAQHMAMNVAKLVSVHDHDDYLRGIVQRCALISADGQGIVLAARLLGTPVPERVTGIDLMDNLLVL